MNRKLIIILSLLLFLLMTGSFVSCGKQDGDTNHKNDEVTSEGTKSNTETDSKAEADFLSVKTYRHGVMPIELELPETAKIVETEDDVYAETSEYMIYVFGMDSYNGGIIYNEMDVVALLNAGEQISVAQDVLRLRGFKVPENTDAQLYDCINGMKGFFCRLSEMQFESKSGEKCSGDGFMMSYGKNEGVGIYVILGILKNSKADSLNERGKEVLNLLKTCALSLRETAEAEEEYIVWQESLTEEISVKAAFKQKMVPEVEKTGEGFCLYYNEAKEGFILLQHFSTVAGISSEEYLESIVSGFKGEGITFSEPEPFRGKMEYRKVTMSYTNSDTGAEMQEIICVTVDEKGSGWIVELFGTKQNVSDQQENLGVLLWSLQED